MKDFKTFEVLNAALGKVTPEAFKVLYYICNNLKIKKTVRTDIDRIDIAMRLGLWYDGCGKRLDNQLKKITKWTDELQDNGFIKKDVIYDRTTNRRTVYYAISDAFITEQLSKDLQKQNDNCSKTYPTRKRTKSNKNNESNESTERVEKTLERECEEPVFRSMSGEPVGEIASVFGDGLPF